MLLKIKLRILRFVEAEFVMMSVHPPTCQCKFIFCSSGAWLLLRSLATSLPHGSSPGATDFLAPWRCNAPQDATMVGARPGDTLAVDSTSTLVVVAHHRPAP
eukprot:6491660-Amphidinium_carterae.2